MITDSHILLPNFVLSSLVVVRTTIVGSHHPPQAINEKGTNLLNVAVRRHNVALPAAFVFHSKGREAWEWSDFVNGLAKIKRFLGVVRFCRTDVGNPTASTGRKSESKLTGVLDSFLPFPPIPCEGRGRLFKAPGSQE